MVKRLSPTGVLSPKTQVTALDTGLGRRKRIKFLSYYYLTHTNHGRKCFWLIWMATHSFSINQWAISQNKGKGIACSKGCATNSGTLKQRKTILIDGKPLPEWSVVLLTHTKCGKSYLTMDLTQNQEKLKSSGYPAEIISDVLVSVSQAARHTSG